MMRLGLAFMIAALLWNGAASLRALEEEVSPLPPDIVRIREAGVLRVAQFSGTRPGFFFFVEGEKLEAAKRGGVKIYDYDGKSLVGHDVEMAMSLANEIGVDLEIVRSYPDFSSTVTGVATGEADIAMTKLSKTLARAVAAELTRPYFRADIVILLHRFREERLLPGTDVLERLAAGGAVFGVIPATSQMKWTQEVFPGVEMKEYANQDLLFEAVHNGDVTAVLYEDFEVKRFFRLWPDIALSCRMVKHPYLADLMVFATRPGDDGLRRLVDAWLERRRAVSADDILDRFEPMMEKDSSKRLGRAAEAERASLLATGSAVVAVALLLASVFFARTPKSRLRETVKHE